MFSIKSLEPIKNASGSNDKLLVCDLMKRYQSDLLEYSDGNALDEDELEELEEFQEYVESMIMCSSLPEKEPGCWCYVIELLAEHHELEPYSLPLEDWKHVYVWEDYRSIVAPHVTTESKQSLKYLDAGRPFRGDTIDDDDANPFEDNIFMFIRNRGKEINFEA